MAKEKARARPAPKMPPRVSYEDVRRIGLQLPGVEAATSYGTPALKVRGKLLARLKEDGETLVLRTTLTNRAFLLSAAPDGCYLTDHYLNYPWMLVRLARVERSFLRELIDDA